MKIIFFLFVFIPLSLLADGPMGENTQGRYGPESMFTKEGQKPMPPKKYDREQCLKANRLYRYMINRIRTITFRIERKCSKAAGQVHNEECTHHINYLDEVFNLFNRQFEVMGNVCLP